MRRLFLSFERAGLDYLLISGQATVLYGAATFSEDVDIWIRPTAENARRLLRALEACRARVYKLTPPLTVQNLRAGHGFHFVVPARPLPIYLDVMGRPPRVGAFGPARRRARDIDTGWGVVPVVHPVDLVELKKTRRLADYDIITNLALIHLGESEPASKTTLRWAARHCFRAEERAALVARMGGRASLARCSKVVATEVAALQDADRRYWTPVISELRRLYRDGKLWQEGASVRAAPAPARRRPAR
jgi:hypothetical protein